MKTLLQGRNKFLSAILALVMAATLLGATAFTGLGSAAFAAWPSFQDDNTNNGVITNSTPPITTPTLQTSVSLSTNNPGSVVYSGIDTTSALNTASGVTTAYTLYNGGVYDSTTGLGGARVAVTNLSTQAVNNILLDPIASNDNQLSVPYYYAGKDTLYAAIQWSTTLVNYTDFSKWTASGNASIDGSGNATFSTGAAGTVVSPTFTLPYATSTIYVPTNITVPVGSSATYSITLTPASGSPIPLDSDTLTSTTDSPVYGTYNTYNGAQVPTSGNDYTLTITITPTGAAVTASEIELVRYDWRLYSVSNVTTANPVVELLVGDSTGPNPLYEGQPNTPISYDNSGTEGVPDNIYWGIWGGTRSYYQLAVGSTTPVVFTPGGAGVGDNFYYAGAALVDSSVLGADYMVFGSDSGTVYVRPVINFDTGTGNTIALVDSFNVPGEIRSTVVFAGADVYFTSKGATDGLLWGIAVTDLLTIHSTSNDAVVKASEASTSTPVVSENGYIYVGANQLFSSGSVQAFNLSLVNLAPVYSGDPVQASPIVYSTGTTDYIYFTTNSGSGAGFCYSFSGAGSELEEWTEANIPAPTGNPYSVQGMASDNGYLVWGDDGNNIYIAH
jgi:hypothetical protein